MQAQRAAERAKDDHQRALEEYTALLQSAEKFAM
jgi:hypothetical protein